MIDLNYFYAQYCANPEKAKLRLVHIAIERLTEAVNKDYYDREALTENINFSEIMGWCGFPDFQDGGIFEQIVLIACNTVLQIMGYKPYHNIK